MAATAQVVHIKLLACYVSLRNLSHQSTHTIIKLGPLTLARNSNTRQSTRRVIIIRSSDSISKNHNHDFRKDGAAQIRGGIASNVDNKLRAALSKGPRRLDKCRKIIPQVSPIRLVKLGRASICKVGVLAWHQLDGISHVGRRSQENLQGLEIHRTDGAAVASCKLKLFSYRRLLSTLQLGPWKIFTTSGLPSGVMFSLNASERLVCRRGTLCRRTPPVSHAEANRINRAVGKTFNWILYG